MPKRLDVASQLRAVPGLRLRCPLCSEAFPVRAAPLFDSDARYPATARRNVIARRGNAAALMREVAERRAQLAEDRRTKPRHIESTSEGSNFGQITEHILPGMPTFPYSSSTCRLLLKPIDYVVFSGLDQPAGVQQVKFVELKTGSGRLTLEQRSIRDTVEKGAVQLRVVKAKR